MHTGRLKSQVIGWLPTGLAIASFLIYAATIFALPQVRDSQYCCEQSSFAAAVSNIAYGSRIGNMYTGVFHIFMTHFIEALPQALKEIVAELPAQPPGKLSPTTLDGNGVGCPLVATAAFRLFGFHWWAPVAMMLILMGSSMAAFLRRFPPTLFTLYFSGLTMMLFTRLVWESGMARKFSRRRHPLFFDRRHLAAVSHSAVTDGAATLSCRCTARSPDDKPPWHVAPRQRHLLQSRSWV